MSFFDDAWAAADESDARRSRWRRPRRERLGFLAVLLAVLLVAGVAGGGWAWVRHQADGRVPHGTRVAGVDLGGLDRAAAVAALRRGLAGRLDAPISVTTGGRTVRITPRQAGLNVDYAASVDQTIGAPTWDPQRLWGFYSGRTSLAPVVDVDQQRLRASLTTLVSRLGTPTRDAAVRFVNGQVQVLPALDGTGVDVAGVSSALERAFVDGDAVAPVPPTPLAPAVTDHALQTAMDRDVNPALASPVTLRFGPHRVVLRPAAYHDSLTLVPHQGVLRLGIDRDALLRLVGPALRAAPKPVEATVRLVDGRPRVVPGRAGRRFEPTAVERAFLAAVSASGARRTARVASVAVPTTFTAEQAAGLGIARPVARFTVPARGVSAADLRRQAASVDGAVLHPGGTFSLDARLGRAPGDRTTVATAVYNAAYLAGLGDAGHATPSAHVPGYPVGREATASRAADLRFTDDSRHGVLVAARTAHGALTVTLWSTPQWRVTTSHTCAPLAGQRLLQVVASRTLHPLAGGPGRTEQAFTTYASLPASVCPGVSARR